MKETLPRKPSDKDSVKKSYLSGYNCQTFRGPLITRKSCLVTLCLVDFHMTGIILRLETPDLAKQGNLAIATIALFAEQVRGWAPVLGL